MTPNGDKIRVTARISKELDTKVHKYYTNLAPAITEGLELLVSMKEGKQSPNWHQSGTNGTGDLLARIGDMERQIEFLKRQIEIKDSQLDKQAYSLQSLIQVNSALNMKLLPEKTTIQTEEAPTIAEEPVKAKELIIQDEPERVQDQTPEPSKPGRSKKAVEQTKEKKCLNCDTLFIPKRSTGMFCSGKCKTAYYRKSEK